MVLAFRVHDFNDYWLLFTIWVWGLCLALEIGIRFFECMVKDLGYGFGSLCLRARLVDCNSNYIGIGIDITRNTKYCNVMIITIYLFGDKTIIETWRQWNENILNQT